MDPNAWRSVESEIVPDHEHSNNHGGKRCCTKQSGRFTLDVPTAFHLEENISWQRRERKMLELLGLQNRKRQENEDSLVRRGDSVSNGLATCIWPQRTPDSDMVQNFSPKLTILPSRHESPSSTGRTLSEDPPRSVPSSRGVSETRHWSGPRLARSAIWGPTYAHPA